MSAFVVSKTHINAIIQAGLVLVEYKPFCWYHNGESHRLTQANADEIGQMLLDECVKSVCYRYDDSPITDLPGRTNAEWLIPFEFKPCCKVPKPIEAIKLIHCLNYQSCEHDEWGSSNAKAFCDGLIHSLIGRVPGYDEAPWTWEDEDYYKAQVVRLTRLI